MNNGNVGIGNAAPSSKLQVVNATCNGTTSNLGHIVRIDDTGTCDVVYDGNNLPMLTYPSLLTIAPPR